MTITRTFEVTITKQIRVNVPDAYDTPEMLADWRRGLLDIDGVDDIAAYAARLVAEGIDGYNNDGVGTMYSEGVAAWHDTQGRNADPMRVTFNVLYDDMETDMIEVDASA